MLVPLEKPDTQVRFGNDEDKAFSQEAQRLASMFGMNKEPFRSYQNLWSQSKKLYGGRGIETKLAGKVIDMLDKAWGYAEQLAKEVQKNK